MEFDIATEEHKDTLLQLLPLNYKGRVIKTENLPNNGFSTVIRINLTSKEAALQWLSDFQEKSKITYRVLKTREENTQKILFKKEYKCMHNTQPKRTAKPHPKHLNCNAKLTITIKKSGMKRSKDVYLKSYHCEILLRHNHNHPFYNSTVLKYRPPSIELGNEFKALFEKGHSPSTALSVFKDMLYEEHSETYNEVVADGQKCPTRKWVYDLYYNIFKKEYGEPTGSEMISSAKKYIDEYNKKCGEICAAMNTKDNLGIAVCSPTMKRVHQYIKASGEIMFVDASGNMDRHNTKVFLFLCPSVAGALPLGVLMLYSESEDAITSGINLLKTIMPKNAFYGKNCPDIIVTDDCPAERNSLHTCFENSTLLLCKFHVLQAVMRFLWDKTNGVGKDERVQVYTSFKKALNCVSENEFLEAYDELLNEQCVSTNQKVVTYFVNFGSRAKLWALCYRAELLTRGNETNNYAEATFRILKDKILLRKKAFSIVQLFDYITSMFEHYYFKKITDISNGRWEGSKRKNKYYVTENAITDLQCTELGYNLYKVVSKDNEYIVNYELELCSCYIGNKGAPCKHQLAVVNKFNLVSQQFHPTLVDSSFKKVLHKVITGSECHIEGWFENINEFSQISPAVDIQEVEVVQGANTLRHSSLTTEESSSETVMHTSDVRNQLQEFVDSLMIKYENNLQEYDKPIHKFIQNFKSCKTDTSLISALYTFGTYNGAGMPKINKGKNTQGGRNIGVQPTAVARRKTPLGGRNAIHSGRPAKRFRLSDHAYSRTVKDKENFAAHQPSKAAAPHSLSYCVENNISLGKTHTKK